MELEEAEPREIELAAIDYTPEKIKTGFSWAASGGGLAALVWLAGAIGAPLSFYGVAGVADLNPALQAGLIALAFGPAVLFWLSASAVSEAMKARKLAMELTRIAQEAKFTNDGGELVAKRLSLTVKNEVEILNEAVEAALSRLNEMETAAQRNATLFSQALAETREDAGAFIGDLTREREAYVSLNDELREQTETMAHSIGRQIRLMREASKLVKSEITAAEDSLENHLAAFANAASVMATRTAAINSAAETAQEASATLDQSIGQVLNGLGEATKLTDAARRSAEEASHAAATTANAVRETTQRAVFEAKKAAQMVRAETEALQESALATLTKLREAAESARAASEESQAAADRHAASIQKRLGALAQTASTRKPAERPAERSVEAIAEAANESFAEESLYAAAGAGRAQAAAAPAQQSGFSGFKGFSGWSNFLPNEPFQQDAANTDADAEDVFFADFGAASLDPDQRLKSDAVDLVAAAGVELKAALDARALETVAKSSRLGAIARRRAVAEASPVAVSRIARYVKRNSEAKIIANDFRARPDLAKGEEKGADLVRAYLLIDAALA